MRLQHSFLPLFLAAAATAWVGCGSHSNEEDPIEEACEHMKDGPANAITAAATGTGTLPEAEPGHLRHDITLTGAAGSMAGFVALQSDEKADFFISLSRDIGFKVLDSANAEVTRESMKNTGLPCTEVAVHYVYELEKGAYKLAFSGSPEATVRMVAEEGHGHGL